MENKAAENLLLPCHLSEATSKCSPPAHSSLATQDCLPFSAYQVYTYLRAFALVVPSASKTFSLKMYMHNSLASFKSLCQCHVSTGLTQTTLNCNLPPVSLTSFSASHFSLYHSLASETVFLYNVSYTWLFCSISAQTPWAYGCLVLFVRSAWSVAGVHAEQIREWNPLKITSRRETAIVARSFNKNNHVLGSRF